MTSRAQAL